MREAMARAEVGDEQIGDDPTTICCVSASPACSAKRPRCSCRRDHVQCVGDAVALRPGDEILAHETAHIIAREGGAHAALGGFQVTRLPGADGKFSLDTFRAALHPRTRYEPPQTVVSVEQTANIGGGTIWAKADLDAIAENRESQRHGHPYGWRAAG